MNNPLTTTSTVQNLTAAALILFACFSLTSCDDDDNGGVNITPADITGTYVQEDIMGRPGITTVFGGMVKNEFNATIPTNRMQFQDDFQGLLEAYHDVYGDALGVDVDYENNILGLDAATFTTVLAQFDALQVAPEGETIYFNPTTGLALTGRRPSDDIVDISLILSFGGTTGARFNGENGLPELVTDNVGPGTRNYPSTFPYLEAPLTN